MDSPRLPRLSLDLLREFHAAARHLSFTRAAQELNITQPAISRGVRTLEDQIGTPLFHRVNRSLQLTRAGQQLFRAADEALRLLDAATRRIAGPTRTLAVTTTVALASTWLVRRLPQFTRLHPELDMRIVASNDWLDLEREQIDLAIRFVPPEMSAPPCEKLFDYVQFPVCAPSLAADAERPLATTADLRHHVLLDFETRLYGRPWYDWERWHAAQGVRDWSCAGSLRFSHYDQIVDAALQGGGVMVGKLPHLTDSLRAGTLVAPLGAAGVRALGAFYLEVSRQAERAPVETFVDWLRGQWRRDCDPVNPAAAAATSEAPPRWHRNHRPRRAPGR